MENQNDCCAIIVYGDIGRSPRMQNHASEISRNTNLTIYLIGYDGNQKNNKNKEFFKNFKNQNPTRKLQATPELK